MSIAHTLIDTEICIPASAATLGGFRTWCASAEFPESKRISFINQDIVIDMSPEEPETHNKVKTEIIRVVANLVKQHDLGTVYSDRMLLVNEEADLSTEPDGMFVSWETVQAQRTRLVPRAGHQGEYQELVGT